MTPTIHAMNPNPQERAMLQPPKYRPISVAPQFRADYVEPAPIQRALHLEVVRRAKLRAFNNGLFVGAIMGAAALALGMTGAAWSDTISISGSTVTLSPSDIPGATAVVTFVNVSTNDAKDNGSRFVSMPGLQVETIFAWEVNPFGADAITVIPPVGMTCQPADCKATAMEGFSAEVLLLEWVGS